MVIVSSALLLRLPKDWLEGSDLLALDSVGVNTTMSRSPTNASGNSGQGTTEVAANARREMSFWVQVLIEASGDPYY